MTTAHLITLCCHFHLDSAPHYCVLQRIFQNICIAEYWDFSFYLNTPVALYKQAILEILSRLGHITKISP